MTGKTLPPILRLDYFRNVVVPRLALGAALTLIANLILFAQIAIG